MSPEQAAGEQDLDGRSDLYALACVLYEMLAGQPPFTGATAEALVRQHMTVDAPPVTNYRPAVPASVAAALAARAGEGAGGPVQPGGAVLGSAPPRRAIDIDDRDCCSAYVSPERTTSADCAGRPPRHRRSRGTDSVAPGFIRAAQRDAASVAVLPFVDLSPERANAYLGDGMAETLINALTNVAGLSVAARTSAFSFRDKAEDVREIGKQLGVATVLEGSVQKAGDRLRVTAQLIKTSDGLHLWSQSFDRSASDIFAVQDEVARAVVTALQGKLIAHPGQRRGRPEEPGIRRPTMPISWALLLEQAHHERTWCGPRSISRRPCEPTRPMRRPGRGSPIRTCSSGPPEYEVPGINQDSILTLAERAARRAIAIAPRLGEAYTSLAEILEYRNRWQEAAEAFQQGIQLSPRYATGHQWYSYDLMVWNRWDEAIREMERARELDPLSYVIVVSLAGAYDGGGSSGRGAATVRTGAGAVPGTSAHPAGPVRP